MTKITYIPGEIANAAIDEHGNRKPVTRTQHIFDDALGKPQSEVNQDRIEDIAAEIQRAQGAESTLDGKIGAEKTRAEGVELGLNDRLETVEQLAEISIGGGDAQIATGADFTNPDATKRAKIPTVGAIVDGLNDGIYDVSKRNPTDGPNSDGKFTLEYILSNADTLIPTGWRHGGMTISFVHSSDNNYVQYRYMGTAVTGTPNPFLNTDNWAICDDSVLVECPEYVAVYTDADGKIIVAVENDGNIHFGAGVPKQVIDYITAKIAELSLDEYEDIVTFLGNLIEGDKTLAQLLDEKVDKVEGKSLIDAEYADGVHYIENPEFAGVWLDADEHILFGVQTDGNFYFGCGIPSQIVSYIEQRISELSIDKIVSFIGEYLDSTDLATLLDSKVDKEEGKSLIDESVADSLSTIEDPEGRLEIVTDSEDKIISYRKDDGTLVENVGIETPNITTDNLSAKEVSIEGGNATLDNATIDNATIDSLNLTNEGMTEFQQALKDSGFQPGGAGDWSDKESMYIPEPRLAHLNIITNFDLTTLTKTSDVKCQVEFYDGVGNYFKKWIILNGQGRSSLSFVKKGLGADFFNEDPNSETFDEDNVFSMKFGDWIYQDSFHIKSFYTDFPRCTTPVVYKLANEVAKTRGIMEDRPYKKYYVDGYSDSANGTTEPSDLNKNIETGARCAPDGFPVIVYQNGEFWGVNSWQLKKHRDNYMLNKKKDSNIHLDGDMGTRPIGGVPHEPFWLWNGNILWNVYCSGSAGIETRNPKNLYCVDGKKYDADTHDAEIITTATAEEWIAAGQIIPTGKVIDDTLAGYLRTTGKVRKHIEDLTTYIPYINGLIDGSILIDGQQATTEQIKAAIEDRFDVATFIDYIVLNNVVGSTDCWDNNGQIITWGKLSGSDNLNWSVNIYDCDITFGCTWDGTTASGANANKRGTTYPLYKIFWDYYFEDLKARYKELRDAGIFDADHITQLFRDWMDRVGFDNYKKEYEKWNQSPCFRENRNDYTLNPQSGGFYGSIYRIYLWVKKRIEYMDAANFFDYNN